MLAADEPNAEVGKDSQECQGGKCFRGPMLPSLCRLQLTRNILYRKLSGYHRERCIAVGEDPA